MKKLKNSNDAVVGIVASFLIVGLVVVVLAVIQTQYVPKWIEEKEADHLDEVENQFVQLKYALDIQSTVNGTTAISSPITLGNKEMPFFNRGRTFDKLEIAVDSCKVLIYTNGTTDDNLNGTYKSDSIKYSSVNYYFINQNFIYEAGALILSQDNKDVLIGRPHVTVNKSPDDKKDIYMIFVSISGVEGKTSISGFGTYDIYTQAFISNMTYKPFYNVSRVVIETDYVNAWNTSFRHSFSQPGLFINYTATKETSPNRLVIDFHKDRLGDYYYDFYIREVEIRAEIGFGLSNA